MVTILLVEDDPLIAHVEREALDGYDVMWASDAWEAAAIAEMAGSRVAILLTDVNLGPGPSGIEVAELALAQRPHLPVLFVTACPPAEIESRLPGARIIAKPFVVSQLRAAVDELILKTLTPQLVDHAP